MPVAERPIQSANSDRVVSPKVKNEEADRKYRARLREILSGEEQDVTAAVKAILRLGAERFEVEHGHLARIDAAEGTRTVTKVSGPHPKIVQGDTVDLSDSYCRMVIAEGASLVVENAREQGWAEDPAYQSTNLACYLGTKVVVGDRLYGTVCFVSREPSPEPFRDADEAFLDLIAQGIGRVLERARREGELRETRRRVERTETLKHRVEEVSGVGGWEVDVGALKNFWTDDARRLLGLSEERPSLGAIIEQIDPGAREDVRTAIERAVEEDEPFTVEVPLRDEVGEQGWVEIHGMPCVGDKLVTKVIGTVRGVTDQSPRMEETEQARWRSVYSQRIGKLAEVLSEALGQSPEWQDRIREAAPLHDVGKVGVPDEILRKPGPLTDEEFDAMKEHTLIGADLLSGGASEPVQMAQRIARSHHERWDGEGYPDGLEGEEIPLAARIVAVVDTFDAMTHDRPYRSALSVEEAFEVIEDEAGEQFDPEIAAAALRCREALTELV